MKDRKIGDVFYHPTMGRLKVVDAPIGVCDGCVFYCDGNVCTNDIDKYTTGHCAQQCRIDRKDVIFVKAKEENV